MRAAGDRCSFSVILAARRPVCDLDGAEPLDHTFKTGAPIRARIGISLFFGFTALGHFIRADEMSAMLPPAVRYRLAIVYLTGILELLGATTLWLPGLMRPAGKCLILMLVCFLPANIYSAIYRIDFGAHGAGPAYLLVRFPFQLFLMG